MTTGDGTQLFPNIAEFVISLLSLPHSSAAAERIYVGLLHIQHLMADSTCYDVEISYNNFPHEEK